MTLYYIKLFEVNITHSFYTVGSDINKSLEIFPVAETAAFVKDGRMLFRKTSGGFTVLFQAIDSDPNTTGIQVEPLVTFNAPVSFTFIIRLVNKAEFLNVTELDIAVPAETFTARKLPFFSKSTGVSSALDYELLEGLRPSVFTYQFPFTAASTNDLGTITIKDEAGATLPDFPVTNIKPDANKNYFFSVDLHKFPKGRYTFETSDNNANPGPFDEILYVDNSIAQEDLFGLIRIKYPNNTNLYGTSVNDFETYTLDFTARQSKWKYFVLNQSGNHTPANLSIDASAESLTFNYAGPTTINNIPAAVFVSPAANIAFREAPRTGIILKDNTTPIIDHMPTPASDRINGGKSPPDKTISEIFVFV